MLSLYYPSLDSYANVPLLPYICHNPSPSLASLFALTPAFLCSIVLCIAGGLLRLWCYRTLGRHFTFEVAILDDHSLITTGPYGVVRHPSYTAACMIMLATTATVFGEDGYIASCGMWNTAVGMFMRLWMIAVPYGAYSVIRRADVEDAELKKTFGARWEAYRESVPYKFIPFLV